MQDSPVPVQPERTIVVTGQWESMDGHLTIREIEILRQLAMGKLTSGIAEDLEISNRTVETHVKHIKRKMRATSRADAVLKAVHWGVIHLTSARGSTARGSTGRTSAARPRKKRQRL